MMIAKGGCELVLLVLVRGRNGCAGRQVGI